MAGAGPLSRNDFFRLFQERLAFLDMIIGPDDWPEADNQWERYYNVKGSDKMREEFLMYAGFGLFDAMNENDSVTYDQMVQGPMKSVTHQLYGKGFQIGYLTGRHDLDGIVARNGPELGRSLRMSVQTQAAALWNNSFSSVTTADGLSLLNTAHTFLRGGGTFSNRSSTDATLGQTALETGIVAFRKQKDLMGNPMPLPSGRLMTGSDLSPLAHEILQSTLRYDTTTNASNYIHGKLTHEDWPFITLSSAWWILGPMEYLKVFWFWNIRPETDHGYDFDKSATKTKTLYASSTVAVDPRGVYGSLGA